MKMFKSVLIALLVLGFVVFFSSCSNNDPAPVALSAVIYKDLNADYAPLVFGSNPALPPRRPAETKKYTLFSFKTGQLVANTDSATTKWDIGFRSTSIIFNGGTSGPGTAGAIVQKGIFDEVKMAPTTGYVLDNKTTNSFAVSSAPFVTGVTTTTNNWWFNSGSQTSTIVTPIAGQIIIVLTTEGRYAKMEIQSYYKGAPTTVNNLVDLDRYYTFKYIYQPGNTNTF